VQLGRRIRDQYTTDEVGELIALAARLDDLSDREALTFSQVAGVAGELGISSSAVAAAARNARRSRRTLARAEARAMRRRMRFVRHVGVYAVVIAGLWLLDAAGGGGWWVTYPAILWGTVVALHGLRFLLGRRGPVERLLAGRFVRRPSIDAH
jgi:2TM domain